MNTSNTASLLRYGGTLLSGILLGSLVAVDSLSYVALVYSGSLYQYMLYGVSAALLGSGILLITLACFSSSKLTISAPQDIFAIIAALVALSLVNTIKQMDSGIDPLPTVLCAITIMTFLLGLCLFFLGIMKLGKLVRYIPYPVIGGFLAGTGWLILVSTLGPLMATHSHFEIAKQFLMGEHYQLWILPFVFGLTMVLVERLVKTVQIFPFMVVFGFLIFYGYLMIQGISLAAAREAGWMLGPFPDGNLPLLPNADLRQGVQWALIGEHIANYFAVIILGVISMLLNVSSFEMSSHETMDINHELKFTGIANLLAGLIGGFGGYQVLSFSKTNLNLGLNSRLPGILAGIFCLLLIFAGTTFLTSLPKFIFSGLLIYVAIGFLVEWLINIKQKISWLDYLIVLTIFTLIVFFGLLVGILVGLLLSLSIFFFRYSRIPVVSSILSGQLLHSNVERHDLDKTLLEQNGERLLVVDVRGYLFFGNTYEMTSRILEQLDKNLESIRSNGNKQECQYLVINFSQVTGIEVSGTMSFINLLHSASQRQVEVLFTNLPKLIEEEIKRIVATEHVQLPYKHFSDLDHALEWCENELLLQHQSSQQEDFTRLFHMTFPDIEQAQSLLDYAEKLSFKKGEVVCHEGDQTKEMFWVAEGELDVIIDYGTPTEKRLRRIKAGTIVGEIALYLEQPRSASVVAAEDCITYRLTAENLKVLVREQPLIAAIFHKSIVGVVAKRLVYANRLLSTNYPL